ncbi:MAG: cytosine permease [Kineosporiaceae bacterium]|nr:cytosine permease [Kineosporiaceae bacterium]MBK7622210.1 cytosine permease [Kineosporiaceae bacterium]
MSVVHDEAPITLTEPAPRTLGLADQLGFWGNLGVSMLGFAGALAILTPYGADPLSLPAAITALLVGTALGALALATTLVMGTRTGMPTMVLLRGLLGAKASFVPTAFNLAQCLGWAIFELIVIAQGLTAVTRGAVPVWAATLIAGIVTTALTIRPLGAIRLLRRYVSVLVVIALVVLLIGLARRPADALGPLTGSVTGSWSGFWLAVDAIVAIGISWVPLGADYSRHARTERSAFLGAVLGYGTTQVLCMLMGILALAQVQQDPNRIFDLFLAMPLGTAAVAVLVLRESDLSFANVYSTAVSIQNISPRWDRRVLTVLIGTFTTAVALTLDISQYTSFLYLIGGVFIPMAGALIGAWLRSRGRGWDTSDAAPSRPGMWLAWGVGFVVYQLINPGSVPGWADLWTWIDTALHTTGHVWLSASLTSFVVAAALAWFVPAGSQPRVGQSA